MSSVELWEEPLPDTASVFAESLQYAKYTSFGNTFLIVDETAQELPDDEHRSAFARWALNRDFGIGGADNVLYLRPRTEADGQPADCVFRIFEWDGAETLSCGNGLLSTAAYLNWLTGKQSWSVLTELPTGTPKLTELTFDTETGRAWVDFGQARPTSDALYRRAGAEPADAVDELPELVVPLPAHEPWADGLGEEIRLTGLLTFSGEPHMALFEGSGFPAELAARLWVEPLAGPQIGRPETAGMRASRALVHHLGSYVDRHYRNYFPQGVHLNFARILPSGRVEYRTWERAINCETLACGSGTIAMAHVALSRGLADGAELEFLPHLCRWYEPEAALTVRRAGPGFLLGGRPRLVGVGRVPRFPLSVPATSSSSTQL